VVKVIDVGSHDGRPYVVMYTSRGHQ
jgi:hypothetical protein